VIACAQVGDRIGGRLAEMARTLPPDLREKERFGGFLGSVFSAFAPGEECSAAGASRGDVEKAAGLDIGRFLVELAHVLVVGFRGAVSSIGARSILREGALPHEERLRAGARQGSEAGDDDGVELEALAR